MESGKSRILLVEAAVKRDGVHAWERGSKEPPPRAAAVVAVPKRRQQKLMVDLWLFCGTVMFKFQTTITFTSVFEHLNHDSEHVFPLACPTQLYFHNVAISEQDIGLGATPDAGHRSNDSPGGSRNVPRRLISLASPNYYILCRLCPAQFVRMHENLVQPCDANFVGGALIIAGLTFWRHKHHRREMHAGPSLLSLSSVVVDNKQEKKDCYI